MKSAKKKKPTAAKKPAASKKATTKTTAPAAEATVQMTEELTAQKPTETAVKETVSPAAKTKPAAKSSKKAATTEKTKAAKVKTESKKEKQTADHLLSFHLIEQFSDQPSKQRCQRNCHKRSQSKTADARNLPFQNEQAGDLRCHCSGRNGKVDAHSGYDRDNQRKYDKHVS